MRGIPGIGSFSLLSPFSILLSNSPRPLRIVELDWLEVLSLIDGPPQEIG
jgi:hypothetical protein